MMESLRAYEWLDGRYRLKEKIGQGSFGEVWLAYDSHLNKDVAAKICFGSGGSENDFIKEYSRTKKLDHPNLIHPLDFGVMGNRPFIIMPYCPSSASKLIGCCNDMMVWEFMRDVSHGLAYLHKKGVVHHDIKPDNILIDKGGQFKITDFGVSTQFGDYYHPGDEAIKGGTEGYMGPEMFKPNAESIKATDIWALGATAYEMLSGELPFYGIGGRAQNGGAVLNEIHHHVSSNLMQLIRDCMAKETWDRPTASEIADYTRILFDETRDHPYWDEYFRKVRKKAPIRILDPEPILEPVPYPIGKPAKKRKLWWIGPVAAAIVGIVIVLWMVIDSNNQTSQKNTNINGAMSGNNPPIEKHEQPAPVQATYLKVNGSDKPELVSLDSKEDSLTVTVETDGPDFSVEIPKSYVWMTRAGKTNHYFVLHLTSNTTSNTRSGTIKVTSGNLITELPISQKPANASNSGLYSSQPKPNLGSSHGNEPKKNNNPKQQPADNNGREKKHPPINIPIGGLKPI
ncbi:MAG: protein kinase [Bacteroidales bacterium]|nr:protein kinase [Bacteroidales bacterium]